MVYGPGGSLYIRREDVEDFGNAKVSWLKRYLELPHGIPSHDTF